MRYRFSVVLAGAAAATAALIAASVSGAGASAAALPAALTTPAPVPTVTLTCPPALPITASVAGVTATSVTIRYTMLLTPPCGYDPPVTVTLFGSVEDAQQWQDPVAEATSGPERNGQVTVDGLTADTEYWYRLSASAGPVPYGYYSVRTAPAGAACSAAVAVDATWSGGFIATVTVRNVGAEALDGWRVSWRWPGDQRITAIWNAVPEGSGTGPDVAVGDAGHNGTVAPGGATTFGMLGAGSAPPSGLSLACGRS